MHNTGQRQLESISHPAKQPKLSRPWSAVIGSALRLTTTTLGIAVGAIAFNPSAASAALLVGNTRGDNILIFDDRTGNFGGELIPAGLGGLTDPDDITFGPDGNLYISSGTESSGSILKFDGLTGEFLGRFDQGGFLARPYGNAFGPDGLLYVSSFRTDEILRFDAITGEFIDVFAAGTGTADGLNGPNDLLFGPDGSLYVTTQGSVAANDFSISFDFASQVLRYDITTGESEVFIDQPEPSPDSFGFVSFLGLALGPDEDLFISDFANDVRRYSLSSGDLVDTLSTNYTTDTPPSFNFIGNLTFSPDDTLFVTGFDIGSELGAILRFDGVTGDPLPSPGESGPVFVPTNENLLRPIGIAYSPIVVPEPGTVLAWLVVGGLGASKLRRRQRS